MNELIALIIVAACAERQEALAKELAFATASYRRWKCEIEKNSGDYAQQEIDLAAKTFNAVQVGVETLFDHYDRVMADITFRYDLPDWDDEDSVMVQGLRIHKDNPAVGILNQ